MTDRDKVIKMLNDMELLEHLDYLKQRWNEEKMYEDYSDYETSISKAFAKRGATLIKGTKAPWGAHVKVGTEKVAIYIKYKGNMMNFAAKRIA